MTRPLVLASLICVGGMVPTPMAMAMAGDILFFGDSLTDSGAFAPALPPGTGRFTTNPGPVWSEVFAAGRGSVARPANQGGLNFATGGARVTSAPGFPDAPPTNQAPPLRVQIDAYLAAGGGVARPDAMHVVWAGANDIFHIAATPAAAATYIQQTANEAAGEIGRLAAAGAGRILVLNLPDIGATPAGLVQGPEGAAGLTALSSGYNQVLFRGLAANGTEVVALDVFRLLSEVQADPVRFGFDNATQPACGATPSLVCTEANLVAAGADQRWVFADGVHPTTGAHRVIAEYVEAVLAGPAFIGQLSEQPVRNQIALSRQLWRSADQNLRAAPVGRLTGWVSAGGGQTDVNRSDGSPRTLSVGLERRQSDEVMAGAALSFNHTDPDWGRAGGYELEDYSLSLYGAYRREAWSVMGLLSFATLDFKSHRHVPLGTATRTLRGRTDGSRFALGAQTHYSFEHQGLAHGPVVSLLHQRVNVTEFDERATDGSLSTNLSYELQERHTTLLSGGWQGRYQIGAWQPYAAALVNHDFDAGSRTIRQRGSASLASFGWSTDGPIETYASLNLGVLGRLGDRAWIDLNVDTVPGRDALEDTRVTATLGVPL
ncbi:autotransporter domain-containing protein [Thioalkalicoccus limnaeus]|uniref:Autotransporter domain-containing protein n=1 Tax=Thioalkalicoccus limnaeus TaxID=120681 RepID=A0ABV4BAL0_9GAMM